jgi:glutaredoxin 3
MANITIYTTPTCVYCKMTKAYLNEKKVPFYERDVMTDETAREEMIQKSGQLGVPVIDIDGTIVVGFDKDRITELAGIK